MEIILKKNIAPLGKMGSIVKVADGYARNFLIPQGIGVEATPASLKMLEKEIKLWGKKAAKQKEAAMELAGKIEKLSLNFARKSGEEDKIFGSVTSIDIIEHLSKNDVKIDRKMIHLEEPIKTLGEFTVEVKLHPEITANLKVSVVKE